MTAEWEPDAPERWTKRMWRDYTQGRRKLMEEVARKIGGVIATLDIGDAGVRGVSVARPNKGTVVGG
jgi:hypothetical protein